jgi:hypothetical protein
LIVKGFRVFVFIRDVRRERINTGTDVRYVKRRADGTFKESDDVARSQRTDRAKKAKRSVKAGYGDQGSASCEEALTPARAERHSPRAIVIHSEDSLAGANGATLPARERSLSQGPFRSRCWQAADRAALPSRSFGSKNAIQKTRASGSA